MRACSWSGVGTSVGPSMPGILRSTSARIPARRSRPGQPALSSRGGGERLSLALRRVGKPFVSRGDRKAYWMTPLRALFLDIGDTLVGDPRPASFDRLRTTQ